MISKLDKAQMAEYGNASVVCTAPGPLNGKMALARPHPTQPDMFLVQFNDLNSRWPNTTFDDFNYEWQPRNCLGFGWTVFQSKFFKSMTKEDLDKRVKFRCLPSGLPVGRLISVTTKFPD
jgi:hypothetical protein